jgi:hypothetical protein
METKNAALDDLRFKDHAMQRFVQDLELSNEEQIFLLENLLVSKHQLRQPDVSVFYVCMYY